MEAESQTIVRDAISPSLLRKYHLDANNSFHRLAVKQIIYSLQPELDPDYQIKLLTRLKKSQGISVNLLPHQNLLPRREPIYSSGVVPLRNAFVLYGVDRMSRKDIYQFISGKFDENISVPSSIQQVQESSKLIEKYIRELKGKIEIKRLDTSHYGILALSQEGKELLKNIFQSSKESIFNNLKEEEADGESEAQTVEQDWRKLPRGWFSTKPYQRSQLCIRHATSTEYKDEKWTILTSPLEEDLIFRVNMFANTLQSEAYLREVDGTVQNSFTSGSRVFFYQRRTSEVFTPLARSAQRSRSRDNYHLRQSQSKENKRSFMRVGLQIFGRRQSEQKKEKKDLLKQDGKKAIRNLEKEEDDLSQRLSRMSCDDIEKQDILADLNKDSHQDMSFILPGHQLANNQIELSQEGEMILNPIEIIQTGAGEFVQPDRVMVEQSDQSQHTETKLKLLNSFMRVHTQDTLSVHQDIHQNKNTKKFKVDPNRKFNYTRYIEQREFEDKVERKKARLRRRQLKYPASISSVKFQNQKIEIVNLISDNEDTMIKLRKNQSTSNEIEVDQVLVDYLEQLKEKQENDQAQIPESISPQSPQVSPQLPSKNQSMQDNSMKKDLPQPNPYLFVQRDEQSPISTSRKDQNSNTHQKQSNNDMFDERPNQRRSYQPNSQRQTIEKTQTNSQSPKCHTAMKNIKEQESEHQLQY